MTKKIQLLSIEDDLDDVYILKSMLVKDSRAEFEFSHAQTIQEASELIRKNSFDAVLLDLQLPDSQGVDSIRLLSEQFPKLPIIVVSDHESIELEDQLIALGAEDFISKRDLSNRLLSRIIRLSIERKLLQLKIEASTLTDDLTELYNRQSFYQHLTAAIAQAERNAFNVAVAFIDLDKFKAINDTFGHRVGDETLRAFGQYIKSHKRESDIAARIGGDEFAIAIFNYESKENLDVYLNRHFSNQPIIIEVRTDEISIDIELCYSLGLNEWSAGDSVDTLIEHADNEMYLMKRKKT